MAGSSARALKLAAGGVAATGVLGFVGLTNAEATHVVKIASHISIRGEGLTFRGRVRSPNSGCVPDRKVTLYRTNGDVLGTTHTNHHGRWRITASGSAGISMGHFYAKVKRESQGTAGTIFVCRGARSRTIPFDQ